MSEFQVVEMFRYPVKSMQGERLQESEVTAAGLAFDRGWAIKDEETGNIQGAKRFGDLMKCSARYLEEPLAQRQGSGQPGSGKQGSGTTSEFLEVPHVEITLPDGATVNSDDSAVNDRLSEVLNHPVSLWPLQPAENDEHYKKRHAEGFDRAAEARKDLALLPDEPFPDFSKFPPELIAELGAYSSPRGTYFDAYPLSLLTRASMRHLEDLVPGTKVGAERFRPNFVLEGDEGERDLAELAWLGREVAVGSARLSVEMEVPRCVMVTREQPGYEAAPRIMRSLVQNTKHCLAVYASTKQAGLAKVGDVLTLVS